MKNAINCFDLGLLNDLPRDLKVLQQEHLLLKDDYKRTESAYYLMTAALVSYILLNVWLNNIDKKRKENSFN